jgi:hypothetical protein
LIAKHNVGLISERLGHLYDTAGWSHVVTHRAAIRAAEADLRTSAEALARREAVALSLGGKNHAFATLEYSISNDAH